MRHILVFCAAAALVAAGACDRDPTLPTTTERPPRLTYGWVRAEGSIIIEEESYLGEFAFICEGGSTSMSTSNGHYAVLLRVERTLPADQDEHCRIDVANPILFSRTADLPVAATADATVLTRFDAIVLPPVPPLAHMKLPIVSVSAAGGHTCAVDAEGATFCWGSNEAAQLGFGWHQPSRLPVRVDSLPPAAAVATSGYIYSWDNGPDGRVEASFSCALSRAGLAYCWGDRIADSIGSDGKTPQRVQNVPSFVALASGGSGVCGRTAAAELYCWPNGRTSASVKIELQDVTDMDTGSAHSCATTIDGKWHCWGYADHGARGDTTAAHLFTQITTGHSFTCAIDSAQGAFCWGRNDTGQLGIGSMSDWGVSKPYRISSGHFIEIDAGDRHACALATHRALYCWGDGNYGQLGHGGAWTETRPAEVGGRSGMRFTSFSAGARHTCGISVTGVLYCWGDNRYGQLGIDSTEDYMAAPVAVWGQQ